MYELNVTEQLFENWNAVYSHRKINLTVTGLLFENENKRQTWLDLYASGSVFNQIHVHILLYYACHSKQFTVMAC